MSLRIKPVCVNSSSQNVGGDVLYELLIFLLLVSARTINTTRDQTDGAKLDAFLSRHERFVYCAKSVPMISEIFNDATDSLC